jgi:hypothetical protein
MDERALTAAGNCNLWPFVVRRQRLPLRSIVCRPTSLLLMLLMLWALAAVVAAQGGGAQGLEVSAFEWKYEGYAPVEVVRSRSGESIKVTHGTDYVFKYASRLTLKNSGARAVKSIEWIHVFSDPETGKELKRYHLELKQRVAAGETSTLAKAVFIKPGESTRHLTTGRQKVQLTRVEFEDGGVWKATEADGRKP